MQPASTKNDIAGEHRDRDEESKWPENVKDTPAELLAVDRHALDEAAHNETLHQCRNDGAEAESDVPAPPALFDLIAELEGNAPQAQRKQHDDQRQGESPPPDTIRDP